MRGIPHKALQCIKCGLEASQQQVHLLHQGLHFLRQVSVGQRREVVGPPRSQLAACTLQWRQGARHHPPHNQHDERRKQQHRHDGAQRHIARHLAAGCGLLRYLDHLRRRLQRIDAVCRTVRPGIAEAQHRHLRQQAGIARTVEHDAVGTPDLDDHVLRLGLRVG
ncbi:hypothetical protein D3C72_1272510 [compost metagenome]